MPRGYRCILIAFVGWLSLAAAPPKDPAANPQGGTNREIASALNNLASALQKAPEPSKHDEPCDPPSNKRSSDLCAQWKAADAAKSAAQAAWWLGGLGALIGAFTLAAAWAAARWAKKAAIETEKGATAAEKAVAETQRIGEAQTRAYLSVVACNVLFADGKPSLQPTIRNCGQSPALEVRWQAEVHFMNVGAKDIRGGKTNPEFWNQTLDIPANGERSTLYIDCIDVALSQRELEAFRDNINVAMLASISVHGKDVFNQPITGRNDLILIFHKAPPNLIAIEMTLGTVLKESEGDRA